MIRIQEVSNNINVSKDNLKSELNKILKEQRKRSQRREIKMCDVSI